MRLRQIRPPIANSTADRGGGYSAIVESSEVGPDGGQRLVDKTVDVLESLFGAGQREMGRDGLE